MPEPSDSVVAVPSTFAWERPEDPASVTTQLRLGERVAELEQRDISGQRWTYVRYAWLSPPPHHTHASGDASGQRSSTAWVPSATLAMMRRPTDAMPTRAAQVRALCCHVYEEPTRKRRPAFLRLPHEAWVELADDPGEKETPAIEAAATGAGSDWRRVRLPDGTIGHVQQGDLALGGLPVLNHTQAMHEARRMIGRPYVWAGATSEGYDCSGLVQMFARRMGVGLPHSSRRMAREHFTGILDVGATRMLTDDPARDAQGAQADWADHLQAGDLLFFAMSPSGRCGVESVDHTGLYDAASGGLLHVSSAGQPECRVEPLWGTPGSPAGRWASRLVAVRRVRMEI